MALLRAQPLLDLGHALLRLQVALLPHVDELAVRVAEQLLVARDLVLGVERAPEQVADLGLHDLRELALGLGPLVRAQQEARDVVLDAPSVATHRTRARGSRSRACVPSPRSPPPTAPAASSGRSARAVERVERRRWLGVGVCGGPAPRRPSRRSGVVRAERRRPRRRARHRRRSRLRRRRPARHIGARSERPRRARQLGGGRCRGLRMSYACERRSAAAASARASDHAIVRAAAGPRRHRAGAGRRANAAARAARVGSSRKSAAAARGRRPSAPRARVLTATRAGACADHRRTRAPRRGRRAGAGPRAHGARARRALAHAPARPSVARAGEGPARPPTRANAPLGVVARRRGVRTLIAHAPRLRARASARHRAMSCVSAHRGYWSKS